MAAKLSVSTVNGNTDRSTVGALDQELPFDAAEDAPAVRLSAVVSRQRRDDGVAQAIRNEDRPWRSCFDQALSHLARTGQTFTSEDCLNLMGDIPADHPNRIGAAMYAAARSGRIELVGYTTSRRPSRHSGLLREWRGAR